MPEKPQKAAKSPAATKPLSAAERIQRAGDEVTAALNRYQCKIVPGFGAAEPVGKYGSKMLIESVWGIALQDES